MRKIKPIPDNQHIHKVTSFVQCFTLFYHFLAHYLAQPLFNPGVVHVVVIDPALVARVVGRINIDALDLPLIPGQQSLERLQIVPTDNHVVAPVGVVCILFLQNPVGDFQVVVDYLVFSDPFKCGHLCDLLYKYVDESNVNDPRIKKWLGEVVGKEGEDLSRHDKWLCMMYPRLKLLHRLLAEDGVIFISIDDTEFSYLKLICDEIFRNFAEAIVWQKRTSPDARKKLSSGHEYVLIYTKNPDQNLGLKPLPLEGRDAEAYTNPDDDPRGPWISSPFTAPGYRPNQMYSITTPTGKTMIEPAKESRIISPSEDAI